MKYAFIDVEATGLSNRKNFVHEIAIIIVIDGEVKDKLKLNVKPPKGTLINDYALKLGNITRDDLENYTPVDEAYKQFVELLGKYVNKFNKEDKFHFCAYNAHFDNGFIRAFMAAAGDKYFGSWFWSNNLDVMVLAGRYLKDVRKQMENFKLMTVAKQLGIEIDESKLHGGMYDIEITYEIFKLLDNDKRI